MSQNPEPRPAVLELDAEKIGDVVVRLGLAAHQLGHEHATGTLRPYCSHPENLTPEAQFVYDIFIRRIPEVIDRWYGGEPGAIEMLYRTIAVMTDKPAPA
jgi:hypothetical protein